jgi:type I restriction enzyme S subunit
MTEKNKSIRNFPNLRFSGFEREWELRKLKEVVIENRLGGNYENSESITGIPVIKMGNLGRGAITTDKIYYLPKSKNYSSDDILKEGDLLFNTRNTMELVGKVALWRNELPFAIYNSNLMRIKVNNLFESSNIFLNSYFNTKKAIIQLRSFATGTTSVAAIYGRDLANFVIAFPNIQEQKKIASLLSLIDNRIQTQKKIIDNLKLLCTGTSYKLFTQKLRLKNTGNLDFPKWQVKLGSEVFESVTNKNHNSDLPILAITQEYGAIPRDLIEYKISVTDKSVESYKIVEIGDFIISLRSFQGGIEYSNYRGICSPAYIILKNKIPINSHFYKYFLKSESYIKLLNKKLEGIRDGKMISYSYFSEIKLPFPSMEEQNKITNFLTSIEEKIETEKKILVQYETQKKFLLANLFV